MGLIQAIGSLFGGGEAQVMPMPESDAPRSPLGDPVEPTNGSNDFFSLFTRTLMGRSDADLTPEELRARANRRAAASQMARGAMENPGESFMDAPTVGGSGFGLQDIAATIRRLF